MTVGGSLSVQNVTPGGGILPAGTVLHIHGLGFTPSTTVQADAFTISAARYTGPQEMEVTLDAPTELTGKRFVVKNADGSEVEYFSSLPYRPDNIRSSYFLFPAQAWSAQRVAGLNEGTQPWLRSKTRTCPPSTFTIQRVIMTGGVAIKPNAVTRTIPAGGSLTENFFGAINALILINSSGPIQALQILTQPLLYQLECLYPAQIDFPTLQVTANPSALSWQWQIGSPAPPSRNIALRTNPPNTGSFACCSSMVSTGSGGSWLSVTGSYPSAYVATVNPSGLAAGTYQGAITVSPIGDSGPPLTIPVSLTVTVSRRLYLSYARLIFNARLPGPAPPPMTIGITGNGGQAEYSITVDQSGLSVSPPTGRIPATLTVSVDPARIAVCGPNSCDLGNIIVTGPQNTIAIPVTLTAFGTQVRPESLTFFLLPGSPPRTQTFHLGAYGGSCYAYSRLPSVRADSAAWLSASFCDAGAGLFVVECRRQPPHCRPICGQGCCRSAMRCTVQVPVALTVLSAPPQLRVTPSNLTFTRFRALMRRHRP